MDLARSPVRNTRFRMGSGVRSLLAGILTEDLLLHQANVGMFSYVRLFSTFIITIPGIVIVDERHPSNVMSLDESIQFNPEKVLERSSNVAEILCLCANSGRDNGLHYNNSR